MEPIQRIVKENLSKSDLNLLLDFFVPISDKYMMDEIELSQNFLFTNYNVDSGYGHKVKDKILHILVIRSSKCRLDEFNKEISYYARRINKYGFILKRHHFNHCQKRCHLLICKPMFPDKKLRETIIIKK